MDITNKKILVCDDSVLARKQLIDAVNEVSSGATFLEAKNGFINPFEKFDISHLIILLMNNILNYVLFV